MTDVAPVCAMGYRCDSMAWTVRNFSKGQINAAGRWLVDPSIWQFTHDPFNIINNFRACHAYPLQIVADTLRKRGKGVDKRAVIAQRTKRLASIAVKLRDNPTMQLARMQDIGGCRAIMPTVVHAEELVKKYNLAHAKNPKTKDRPMIIRRSDYIQNPKIDGYRGVHLIIRYQTKFARRKAFHGHDVEVQIRSDLQHMWATAVETAQTFTGQALKSKIKRATDDWLRFFALMSTVFAIRENRPVIPNTSTDLSEIRGELRDIQERQRITQNLTGWRTITAHQESAAAEGDFYYLLVLDTKTMNLTIRTFPEEAMGNAQNAYLELERKTKDEQHINVVLVSVDSLANLVKAYPNYYVDSSRFIAEVETFLRA